VRRLAGWGVPAEQAIAAATMTPRRVLGDDRSLPQLLLGTPLAETLRWNKEAESLVWQRAVAASIEALKSVPRIGGISDADVTSFVAEGRR